MEKQPGINAFKQLSLDLQSLYDARQAENIARIVFEERWNWRGGAMLPWSEERQAELLRIRRRLLAGEPWQYVLGIADFYGLKLRIDPRALIPRPETEELVYAVLSECKGAASGLRLLDVGTGSGCIALTLARRLPQAQIEACDISSQALALASENAELLGVNPYFFEMDILGNPPAPDRLYDRIVSNPPYIPLAEAVDMHINVKDHEPHSALFVPDAAPLVFYEALARYALRALRPGGCLHAELHPDYGQEVAALWERQGLSGVSLHRDMYGRWRMARAVRP